MYKNVISEYNFPGKIMEMKQIVFTKLTNHYCITVSFLSPSPFIVSLSAHPNSLDSHSLPLEGEEQDHMIKCLEYCKPYVEP